MIVANLLKICLTQIDITKFAILYIYANIYSYIPRSGELAHLIQ